LRLDLSYRDSRSSSNSQPGLPPYSDFPGDYKLKPNLFGAAASTRTGAIGLTLGVIAGLENPRR